MFYPASSFRQPVLAATVVAVSVSAKSTAAAEQEDNPQAGIASVAETTSSVSSAAATAAQKKDDPQAGITSETRRRFASASTVCCT